MASKIISPAELMEIVSGFRKSRILLTAYELNIFTVVADKPLSSSAVAAKTGTAPRATDRLMNALVAMGLLEKSRGLFANTALAARYLAKSSPDFMSGLSHQVHLWNTWSTLTEAVKKGNSVTIRETISGRDETWLKSFIAAMHSRKQQAEEVAQLLNLSGVRTMLDVGGGSGAFTYAFIRKNSEIKGTIFDIPEVIPITKGYIEKEGFSGSVNTISGDYRFADFGKGYDLILVSAVIHINSEEENKILVQKCADALNPCGRLVILDHIMSEDRTEPEIGAIFAINMLVGTEKGDTYTGSEITSWMKSAGFKEIHIRNTPQETYIMIGTK